MAQRGSLNAPDRLRFDFSHGQALSADQIAAVEEEVNAYVRRDDPVTTRIMTPDEARALGAQALFGEKYGDEVRVVSMGQLDGSGKGSNGATYSIELCGGTHVPSTGRIGLFVTTGDAASSAGVRRIEALTGEAARAHLAEQERRLAEAAQVLRARPEDVPARVRTLLDERRALQNEVAQLKRTLAMGGGDDGAAHKEINGMRAVLQVLDGIGGKELPGLVDDHKQRLGSGVVVLVSDAGGKAAVAAGVTPDLTGRVSAVDLVRAAAAELGGKGGGGRPDMAQAGGPSAENAAAALAAVEARLDAL